MDRGVPQESTAQNAFEELTLSELLTILLNAGYSFEQLKRMRMAQIYDVVREATPGAPSVSQAQAA